MSTPPAAPTDHQDRSPIDTRDMVVVHTALLREFRLAPAVLDRPGADTPRQRARIADHLGFLCDVLDHHHQGEDDLLWPLLEARAPSAVQPWVATMHTQHEKLEHDLTDVRRHLAAWATGETSSEPLRTALVALHADLAEHLDHEEREVLPVAAQIVTLAEWRALGERGVAALPKARLPLLFGMMMYEGDPEVLAEMLAVVPPLPRFLLPRIAPRLYARHARRLYGTHTP